LRPCKRRGMSTLVAAPERCAERSGWAAWEFGSTFDLNSVWGRAVAGPGGPVSSRRDAWRCGGILPFVRRH